MSISRLRSALVVVVLVVTAIFAIRAGTATGAAVSSRQDLSGCVQGQLASASPADRGAVADWVARHAASLKAGNAVDLSDYVQRPPGSASPADTAATDWVARHAASLKAGNAVDLSDYVQRPPGSASPADRGATADWVARHAASLKAGYAVVSGC
jgi:hypothetical protein